MDMAAVCANAPPPCARCMKTAMTHMRASPLMLPVRSCHEPKSQHTNSRGQRPLSGGPAPCHQDHSISTNASECLVFFASRVEYGSHACGLRSKWPLFADQCANAI